MKIESLVVNLHQDHFQYLSLLHHIDKNSGIVDLQLIADISPDHQLMKVLLDIGTIDQTEPHTNIREETRMKEMDHQNSITVQIVTKEKLQNGLPMIIIITNTQIMTKDLVVQIMKEVLHRIEEVQQSTIVKMIDYAEVTSTVIHMQLISRETKDFPHIETTKDLDRQYVLDMKI